MNVFTPADSSCGPLPTFLRPNFERMPPELKTFKNWVLWAAVWNGSKWTKRPIQINGFGASTTNPKHWSSFDDVKQAYDLATARGYMELRERGKPAQQVPVGGAGFVFDGLPDKDGLVLAGVDFDKVISGSTITSLAQERIRRLGSYTERSVSGSGLHVIVKALPLASGIAHGGVEMYTSGRYFTMTGHAPSNARIVAAPEPFAALAEELRKFAGNSGPKAANPPQPAEDINLKKEGINLKEFESAANYLAKLSPSPFKEYPGWRDFMFACAHTEAISPAASQEIRQIFSNASMQSGGNTSNNDQLYEDALAATQEKIANGG
jgi:putative DNA primase/helicase